MFTMAYLSARIIAWSLSEDLFRAYLRHRKWKLIQVYAETIYKYWILNYKALQNSGKWCENRILWFLLSCYLSKALFILYRTAFAPPRKPCRIRLLFPHKNGYGSKVERHISDRFCVILWCNVNAYSDPRAPPSPPGNKYERVLEPTETEVNFQE